MISSDAGGRGLRHRYGEGHSARRATAWGKKMSCWLGVRPGWRSYVQL